MVNALNPDIKVEEPIYGSQYLPRKFKIRIAIPPRNDVDIYSNDLGFISDIENGEVKGYTRVLSKPPGSVIIRIC